MEVTFAQILVYVRLCSILLEIYVAYFVTFRNFKFYLIKKASRVGANDEDLSGEKTSSCLSQLGSFKERVVFCFIVSTLD